MCAPCVLLVPLVPIHVQCVDPYVEVYAGGDPTDVICSLDSDGDGFADIEVSSMWGSPICTTYSSIRELVLCNIM